MSSKTIDNILKNVVLVGLFGILIIPLYVENSFFFPFITGKAFAFRIIVEIAFFSWILLFLRDKNYLPKWSGIQIAFSIFTLIILIADIFGLSFLRSFWSNFERMDGWITLIHIWAYFIVLSSMLSVKEGDHRMWHNYFNASLLAASIVGIYGFFQLFGWAEIHQGSSRIDASLGNAIYMAVYMMFNSFIAIYMAINYLEKGDRKKVLLYSVIFIAFAFLMFQTATRGVVLGYLIGFIFGLIIIAFGGKDKKLKIFSISTLALLFLVGSLFWLNRDASFIQKSPLLKRFADISINDTKTQARSFIWPMAVKGIFENTKTATIGVGQENFNYIFNSNYNPEMWRHEQWFDRAHNTFLDWMVAGGLLGLVSYLSIFILAIISIIKSDISVNKKAVLAAILIAYSFQSIFTFDNLASYMYLYIILAFIASLRSNKNHEWINLVTLNKSKNSHVYRDYLFNPIIVIIFISLLFTLNVRPISANTRLISALISCSGGNNIPSVDLYKKALDLDKYMANQEIREQIITCGTNVARSNVSENLKVDFINLAASQIDSQMNITPNDARIYVIGGTFMNNIGNYIAAELLLTKALELSPNKQTTMFELATAYINNGKKEEALSLMKKAYESAKDNDNSKVGYISALVLAGQDSKIKSVFGNDMSGYYDERVAIAYMNQKNYPKAFEIYKKIIENNPTDQRAYLNLAGAYYSSGDKWSAIEQMKIVGNKFPELKKRADDAIKELNSLK